MEMIEDISEDSGTREDLGRASPQSCAQHIRSVLSEDRSPIYFTCFHLAVVRGDVEYIRQVFSHLPEEFRTRLLNTLIRYTRDNDGTTDCTHFESAVSESDFENIFAHSKSLDASQLCLALGCFSGNEHIIDELLGSGVNVTLTDGGGDNIIHLLVVLGQNHAELAAKMYKILIENKFTISQIYELLHQENNMGLIPLESAAVKFVPDMMIAIMETEHVYKHIIVDYGITRYVCYDITDYHCGGQRNSNNVLRFLTYCTSSQLETLHKCQILEKEPFKQWINQISINYRLLVLLYFTTWVLMVSMFSVSLYCVSRSHRTSDLDAMSLVGDRM